MINEKQYREMGYSSLQELEVFLDSDDVKSLIGKNFEHYHDYFITHYDNLVNAANREKVKGGFNWLCLLSPPVWFAYRKMYTYFFGFTFGMAALTFAEVLYGFETGTGMIVAMLILTFYSKYSYFQHLRGLTIKMSVLNHKERVKFLKWHGGVSVAYAVLAIPVFLAFNFSALVLAEFLVKQ